MESCLCEGGVVECRRSPNVDVNNPWRYVVAMAGNKPVLKQTTLASLLSKRRLPAYPTERTSECSSSKRRRTSEQESSVQGENKSAFSPLDADAPGTSEEARHREDMGSTFASVLDQFERTVYGVGAVTYKRSTQRAPLRASVLKRPRPKPGRYGPCNTRRSSSRDAYQGNIPEKERTRDARASGHGIAEKGRRERTPLNGAAVDTPSTVQVFLDFGQKDFDRRECGVCGMVYAPGVESDERLHRKLHNQRSNTRLPALATKYSTPGRDGARYLVVDQESPRQLQAKCAEAMKQVKELLGMPDPPPVLGTGSMAVLAFETSREVIGLLVVDPISITESNRLHRLLRESTTVTQADDSAKACVAVRMLWVSASHRRKLHATSMMELVRSKFLFGTRIEREAVAFCQPTTSGLQFARSYTGRDDVLIYLEGVT